MRSLLFLLYHLHESFRSRIPTNYEPSINQQRAIASLADVFIHAWIEEALSFGLAQSNVSVGLSLEYRPPRWSVLG